MVSTLDFSTLILSFGATVFLQGRLNTIEIETELFLLYHTVAALTFPRKTVIFHDQQAPLKLCRGAYRNRITRGKANSKQL